jgi:hypothetical protein
MEKLSPHKGLTRAQSKYTYPRFAKFAWKNKAGNAIRPYDTH